MVLDKSKMVGYIIASQKENNHVHIHKYVVDEPYRRRNIGRKLLQLLNNDCIKEKVTIITLNVYVINTEAIRFHMNNSSKIIRERDTSLGINILMATTPEHIKKSLKTRCL